ncbi:3-oxoacyl-ACP synthase III family protein [Streptomyces sp. NBC_01142]|uniref:3-oxoacyl-ACP synthase III family protein n=1 Tax=Streptomyces sp. NBC_01142 TaxID=2975865 RepID=UPI002259E7F2|nr:3-oxoacyl-ACP synthase III family protein [Streptomyces sp. NBC_01142]MCX4820513.1 3-oxoacyl-ACP synthase III family protein [Streptomyces sp. NBC_01142]
MNARGGALSWPAGHDSGIGLAGVGTALPGDPVDNAALSRWLGITPEWVEGFIGTRTRHFAVDLDGGSVRWTLEDLCTDAADRALADAGADPDDVAFIVVATATPDALMPTTAALVADRLGIDGVPVYQLQSGCTGAVQAMALASSLLAHGARGRPPVGLVVGGDVCSKHLDLRQNFRELPPSQLVNYVLFGDGAGAAVLSRAPGAARARLTRADHWLSGLGRAPGQRVEWFGQADRHSGRPAVVEDYKAIEALVPVMAQEVLDTLLDSLGWPAESLGHVLPPQLSGRMTERITRGLRQGLEWDEVSCVAETGNNGNALVFFQLERLLPRLEAGGRAVGIAIESSKWIKAGFAVEASG